MANINKIVGIYKITSPTGKIYIGQSWDVLSRLAQHKREKRPLLVLNKSILKYGAESHKFGIVHILPKDISQKILDTYEQIYIDAYKACGSYMLNMRDAGARGKMSKESCIKMGLSNKGRKPWNTGLKGVFTHTAEAIEKINAAHRGTKHSPETILKMKKAATGRMHTEESKAKMSEQRKGQRGYRLGQKNSPEHIEKVRAAMIGFKHSEETKKKISKNNGRWNKGKKMSAETNEKNRMARLGIKHTQEHKNKISEELKKHYSSRPL